MASTIKIKRSGENVVPSSLASGELAYSYKSGVDKLFIGWGSESEPGVADNIAAIGGKFYTDLLTVTAGTLTASKPIIVDASKKINELFVDNLSFDANTISSTNTDGNVLIDPAGAGYVQIVGTNGLVIPVGTTVQRGPTTTGTIRYNTSTSQFEGYSGTNWSSLGGVRSVDGLTFISAESAPGDSDDTLRFYTDGTLAYQIDTNSAQFETKVTNVNVAATTASTSTTTGALTVAGGVGIGGALYVNGAISAASASFASLNNTPIGNVTPSTGAFTQVDVDNISINLNTISSTNTDGNINITPAGNGRVVLTNPYVGADSLAEYIQDITGGQLVAGEGIDLDYNDVAGTTTISAEIATTSTKGIASFNTNNFTLSAGAVSTKTITLGSSTLNNGSTTTAIAGLTELTVDNLNLNGSTIAASGGATDISITLDAKGAGTVDVSGSRITSLGDPTQSSDAANKAYVDSVAEGLSVKPAVRAATAADLGATYNNGTAGVGATLTIPAIAVLDIDGVDSWTRYDGILVKDQSSLFQNGRYYVDVVGNISSPWVLVRCGACDTPSEIPSMYVFVQEGDTYNSTGWVATVDTLPLDVGTGDIVFTQFSGVGTYLAGQGLSITGSTFNVGGTTDRITVGADSVDIASTYVGQTSIATLGTISTGTWNATVLSGQFGGTGVVNTGKTITLGGNLTTVGPFTTSLTATGNTALTLPTSGTLATLAGVEALSNKTITLSSFSGTTVNASGLITFTNATEATSASVASVVLSGGLGITKDIRLSGDLIGSGASTSLIDGFMIDGGTY